MSFRIMKWFLLWLAGWLWNALAPDQYSRLTFCISLIHTSHSVLLAVPRTHTKLILASGSLPLLFFLPGILFLLIVLWLAPSLSLQMSAPMHFLEEAFLDQTFKKKHLSLFIFSAHFFL